MARLDKLLWAVRLFKTRSLATDACKKGHVTVNEIISKPSKELKVNDTVVIRKSGIKFQYKIKALLDKRVGAKLVENYIDDITPIEELERYKLMQLAQKEYRDKGTGRPTKKDRRELTDFNTNWEE